VERLMRANGWRGNVRGPAKIRTTVPEPADSHAPDLDFAAQRPGQLLVCDFTYVPLAGGGFGYTAFVIDAFAGTICGWECSLSKAAAFVQRALAQASAHLRRTGGAPGICHSDAGS
jgi:putative transposase